MNWLMTLRIALRALRRNKLRAFLTMLGIIIGVGAVIAMVAIGEGAKATIRSQIASLGTNVLVILPGTLSQGGVRTGSGGRNTLLDSDARAIRQEVGSVAFTSPVLRRGEQVVAGNLNWGTLVQGVAPEFQQIRDWEIESGRFIHDGDVESAVYRNRTGLKKREAMPAFLRYAAKRLRPLNVRVGVAVFGLSAARDLGIGQLPRRMAPYVDTIYAMTYPSLFGPGELGIADPGSTPGETVARALKRFQTRLRGTDALLVPWVQDFSFTTPYDLGKVQAQIEAGRRIGAKGYLLWNAEGVYTDGALSAP